MSFQKRNPISKELCPFHFLVLLHLVMFTEQKSCDFTPVFICYPFEVILQYNSFCKLSAEHQCSSRIRILKLFVTIGYNRLRQVTIELKQDFSQKRKGVKRVFQSFIIDSPIRCKAKKSSFLVRDWHAINQRPKSFQYTFFSPSSSPNHIFTTTAIRQLEHFFTTLFGVTKMALCGQKQIKNSTIFVQKM